MKSAAPTIIQMICVNGNAPQMETARTFAVTELQAISASMLGMIPSNFGISLFNLT